MIMVYTHVTLPIAEEERKAFHKGMETLVSESSGTNTGIPDRIGVIYLNKIPPGIIITFPVPERRVSASGTGGNNPNNHWWINTLMYWILFR